jgi:DNA helicase-2/ATP-dependent DNA helicase PcrA
VLHESHGTADPSDLAAIATHILTSDTRALAAFRTKLRHVILDEYQDVSVTQHALIRTIVRGVVDEAKEGSTTLPPVLDKVTPFETDHNLCYQVPRLFCGGDSHQSIYGWRGAAPYISTEGFHRDYPQGIVVPLDTSFRLSQEVWHTANGLIDSKHKDKRRVISLPAKGPEYRLPQDREDPDESLMSLFLKVSSDDETPCPVRVQGLWDAREEAKFIASTVRNRCKARMKRCSEALGQEIGRDPSDVAVMVRSGKQLTVIKEALAHVGVPFVVCTSEDVASPSQSYVHSNIKLMDMKPVVVMTMHRAKGEEFDDVYLAGWTEGTFPHPTSISANRVDEERRLAFVAVTRARQQIVITHAFIDRVLYNGPDLKSRYVTQQVSPSRFLYELVPAAITTSANTVHNGGTLESKGLPSVVWYRGKGIKEYMAGRDVPDYFAKSYKVEASYRPAQPTNRATSDYESKETGSSGLPISDCECVTRTPESSQEPPRSYESRMDIIYDRLTLSDHDLLNDIRGGLDDICLRKVRGSKGKFKTLFRNVLGKRFNLKRGNALVLPEDEKDFSYDALLGFDHKRLEKKPLSRSTAIELGQYIFYRLMSPLIDSD